MITTIIFKNGSTFEIPYHEDNIKKIYDAINDTLGTDNIACFDDDNDVKWFIFRPQEILAVY